MTDSFDQAESLPSKTKGLDISDPTSQPPCQGAVALGEEPGGLGSGEKRGCTCNLRNLSLPH